MMQICTHCHHASGAHGGAEHCDGCDANGRYCGWAGLCYGASHSYRVAFETACTTCGHTAQRHEESTYCTSCADCDCPAFSARGCLESPTTAKKLGLTPAEKWARELIDRIVPYGSFRDRTTRGLVEDLIREVQAEAVRQAGGFDIERLQNQEIADLRARIDTLQKIPAIAIVDRLRQSD